MQVLSHAGEVGDDVDSVRPQVLRGADPRVEEKLRRPDGPTAQDDLRRTRSLAARGPRPLDADAAVALEQQAPRRGAQDELEVGARLDRADVRGRRAVADAVLDRVLHERHTVLRGAVVVGVRGDAALLRGLGDRHVDRVRLERGDQAHGARPAGLAPLDALVDRQHVLPRPPFGAETGPRVEVVGRPAHPDHRVQAARSPEHLSAWPCEATPRRVGLRHRLVRPVDLGQPELVDPARVVDRRVVVAPARLEQEHPRAALHEPARDDGARGARADHHDIGVVLAHGRLASVMGTTLEPLPVPCHVAPT